MLNQFPLLGVLQSLDVYASFKFEPMHTLALGLSKMLGEYLFSCLSDADNKSFAITYQSGQPRPYEAIKTSVLKLLNSFLKKKEEESVKGGLKVDFSKEKLMGSYPDLLPKQVFSGCLRPLTINKLTPCHPFMEKLMMSTAEIYLLLLLLKYSHGTLILHNECLGVLAGRPGQIKKF